MGLDNPLHIVFLVIIIVCVFGAKRVPEVVRSLGTGLREFKQTIDGEDHLSQTRAPALLQPPGPLPLGHTPHVSQVAPTPVAGAEPPAAVKGDDGTTASPQQRDEN